MRLATSDFGAYQGLGTFTTMAMAMAMAMAMVNAASGRDKYQNRNIDGLSKRAKPGDRAGSDTLPFVLSSLIPTMSLTRTSARRYPADAGNMLLFVFMHTGGLIMKHRMSGSRALVAATTALALSSFFDTSNAATIRFNDLVTGATSYAFDGDGDGINDVTFSTTDPAGFNTIGPGLNQSYISEPGLEGTSLLTTDLRVDFAKSPTGSLSFGFALDSFTTSSSYFANFKVYDSSGGLLGQSTVVGAYTTTGLGVSTFPEGLLTVSFAGAAAYGLFNFSSQLGRYIIDDFTGNFGSVVPEPSATVLLLLGLCALLPLARRAASMHANLS